jgi:hypothetical protein
MELTQVVRGYLKLRDLARYSGLSVRTLRQWLNDPENPLPCYRVGGVMLVKLVEFERWIEVFRRDGDNRGVVEKIVARFID